MRMQFRKVNLVYLHALNSVHLVFDAQPDVGEIEANPVKLELVIPEAATLLVPLHRAKTAV